MLGDKGRHIVAEEEEFILISDSLQILELCEKGVLEGLQELTVKFLEETDEGRYDWLLYINWVKGAIFQYNLFLFAQGNNSLNWRLIKEVDEIFNVFGCLNPPITGQETLLSRGLSWCENGVQ